MENNSNSAEFQLLNQRYINASKHLTIADDLKSPSQEIVTILVEYLSFFSKTSNLDDFLRTLQKLSTYNNSFLTDFALNQIAWEAGTILQSAALPEHRFQLLESYFQTLEQFDFRKPSKGYSRLLSGLLYYGKSWSGFLSFVNWWGWDSFSEQDFIKTTKGEVTFPSLAERVTNGFGKNIFSKLDDGIIHLGLAISLLSGYENFLSSLEAKDIKFEFATYYQAKALKHLGQKERARQVFISFAKRKRRDFWVWDLLGDLQEDSKVQLACQFKGLSCPGPAGFKVALMEKTILNLVNLLYHSWAKYETQKLIQLRQKNNWSIPRSILAIQQEDWYKSTTAKLPDNELKKMLIMSEQLLEVVSRQQVLISRVIVSKKLITGITEDNQPYVATFRGSGPLPMSGDCCQFSHVKTERGLSMVVAWESISEAPWMRVMKKEVQGKLKQVVGKGFGFVSDVFVAEELLKKSEIPAHSVLKIKAVKSYDPTKKKWSWMAFEVVNQ